MSTIRSELVKISKRSGGMLTPEKVVLFAENPKTALHESFEWDDSIAGPAYRVVQAKQIIRAQVRIVGDGKPMEIRAWVSLSTDREHGKGYRQVRAVLEDDEHCETLLEDAKRDYLSFRKKYQILTRVSSDIEKFFSAGDDAFDS